MENKTLRIAMPWKGIHLTSKLQNTIFEEEQQGIKPMSQEGQPDALTTMLP